MSMIENGMEDANVGGEGKKCAVEVELSVKATDAHRTSSGCTVDVANSVASG